MYLGVTFEYLGVTFDSHLYNTYNVSFNGKNIKQLQSQVPRCDTRQDINILDQFDERSWRSKS